MKAMWSFYRKSLLSLQKVELADNTGENSKCIQAKKSFTTLPLQPTVPFSTEILWGKQTALFFRQ